jgi:hypothetical protein
MNNSFKINTFYGLNIEQFIETLATLRLNEFIHYPYLYAGTKEAEIKYLSHYSNDDNAFFVIAVSDNDENVVNPLTLVCMQYKNIGK